MTPDSPLSVKELIEQFATKVMHWQRGDRSKTYVLSEETGTVMCQDPDWWYGDDGKQMGRATEPDADEYYDGCPADLWNPITDWNHWREVEEKIMEDGMTLFRKVCTNVVLMQGAKGDGMGAAEIYVLSDLRTRCLALRDALSTLPS